MYDPQVVDTFFAIMAAGSRWCRCRRSRTPRHSALQTPLRAGEGHRELDLQTFFDFGRALAAPASMAELGEIVWRQFKTRLPASTFVLYGYDQVDDSIVAVYEAGVEGYPVRTTRDSAGRATERVGGRDRQTVVNSDARLDLDDADRDQSALRSALAVPVISNGRSAGVLSFYACEPNAFDDTHRRVIVAAGLALAPCMA